jgi:hypothetical protein
MRIEKQSSDSPRLRAGSDAYPGRYFPVSNFSVLKIRDMFSLKQPDQSGWKISGPQRWSRPPLCRKPL